MSHNLVAVCNFQFPQLIVNRNKRSKGYDHQKKKPRYCKLMCFAVNKNGNNDHHQNPPIFSLKFSSVHPLSESPQASFDDYIEDEGRLMRATFVGKCEQLNQDEWRVEMPSFQLLFQKARPLADVRLSCRSSTQDSPLHIPQHISKFLDLQLLRWEMKGLGTDFKPQSFTLNVKGAFYAERTESKSVLNNTLVLNLHNFAPPTPFGSFAQDFLQPLVEKGLKGMMEEAMHECTQNLLLDYTKYKEEKLKNEAQSNYS